MDKDHFHEASSGDLTSHGTLDLLHKESSNSLNEDFSYAFSSSSHQPCRKKPVLGNAELQVTGCVWVWACVPGSP